MNYQDFLQTKQKHHIVSGFDAENLHANLLIEYRKKNWNYCIY
jgi:hypothetical protein